MYAQYDDGPNAIDGHVLIYTFITVALTFVVLAKLRDSGYTGFITYLRLRESLDKAHPYYAGYRTPGSLAAKPE